MNADSFSEAHAMNGKIRARLVLKQRCKKKVDTEVRACIGRLHYFICYGHVDNPRAPEKAFDLKDGDGTVDHQKGRTINFHH